MNFVLDLCGFRSCCECGAEHVQSRILRARCPIGARTSTRPPAWTCRFLKIDRNNNSVCGGASNRKGCDIGYDLAANSCEGVNSVDTCTVTALDAITAFAVPNPGGILAEQSVFSGLVVPRVALMNGSLSLFQTSCVLRSQSFSAVDIRDTSR